MKKIDIKGKVFGRLTVLEEAGKNKGGDLKWLCLCECGNKKAILGYNIKSGHTKSCGCITKERLKEKNTTYGLSSHPLYNTWKGMQARCLNPSTPKYKYYGGRGVTVCEKWLDINNFIKDMYPSYKKGLQLDRIDNDKGYSKDNCRWVTRQQNNSNTRPRKGSSKYKGVSFNTHISKWTAQIVKNGKHYPLGTFISEVEAAIAYNNKAYELNGKHAYLNKIED